jgi:hypothetical protein
LGKKGGRVVWTLEKARFSRTSVEAPPKPPWCPFQQSWFSPFRRFFPGISGILSVVSINPHQLGHGPWQVFHILHCYMAWCTPMQTCGILEIDIHIVCPECLLYRNQDPVKAWNTMFQTNNFQLFPFNEDSGQCYTCHIFRAGSNLNLSDFPCCKSL